MVDEDLGAATLVYEGPDGDTIEETVENEHVAYFQDHWIVKTDGDGDRNEDAPDTIRRIPSPRVYYVEREVESFQGEVSTVLDDVQEVAGGVGQEVRTIRSRLESVATDVQSELSRRRPRRTEPDDQGVHRIQVETGDPVGSPSDESERDDESA